MTSKRLTTEQRKAIFQTLVTAQDSAQSVRKSYETVTEQYEISESQLRQIEEEGIDNQWPPLCEVAAE